MMKPSVIDMAAVQAIGWTLVHGVSSTDDLLQLGRAVGVPTRTPNGELVKEVRRVPQADAPPGSQSALYGSGPFPFHTDTVFWPTPVRYVLLRGYGDVRRPTTLARFSDFVSGCTADLLGDLDRSVWRVTAGRRSFYCSLRLTQCGINGWRYDPDLMLPANESAERTREALTAFVRGPAKHEVHWDGATAAVICNWTALHGRGPEPPEEGARTIERLYVR